MRRQGLALGEVQVRRRREAEAAFQAAVYTVLGFPRFNPAV
jgi:hypothetical protein